MICKPSPVPCNCYRVYPLLKCHLGEVMKIKSESYCQHFTVWVDIIKWAFNSLNHLVWRMFAAQLHSAKEMLNTKVSRALKQNCRGSVYVCYVLLNTHLHYPYCTNVEFGRLYCWYCISAHHSWWFLIVLRTILETEGWKVIWFENTQLSWRNWHTWSHLSFFILFLVKVNSLKSENSPK